MTGEERVRAKGGGRAGAKPPAGVVDPRGGRGVAGNKERGL